MQVFLSVLDYAFHIRFVLDYAQSCVLKKMSLKGSWGPGS
jgi:hypothetical protein